MKVFYTLIFIILKIICLKTKSVEAIFGGKLAKTGEFKYHASVLINDIYACGGAIISHIHVVTVAQCIMTEDRQFLNAKLSITAGIITFDSRSSTGVSRFVKTSFIPYEYKYAPENEPQPTEPEPLDNGDIAILLLYSSLPLGPGTPLDYAILPQKNRKGVYDKFMYKSANITGFGLRIPTSFKKASDFRTLGTRLNNEKRLFYAETIGYRSTRCMRVYHNIKDSHLCASTKSSNFGTLSGVCHGDIGGPLALIDGTLIGLLINYRQNCEEKFNPSLYTRISHYIPFIESVMEGLWTKYIRVADYTDSERTPVVERIHKDRMSDMVSTSKN